MDEGKEMNIVEYLASQWRIIIFGFMLIILIWGMFYLGAYYSCRNGNGILVSPNLAQIYKYQCTNFETIKTIQINTAQIRIEDMIKTCDNLGVEICR